MIARIGRQSSFFVSRRIQLRFYSLPAHTVINMPALSPTMTQGNLGQWQKKVGDQVNPGDVLVEIETDKAQMDFECQDEGYLAKILLEAGKDIAVNTPIAVLVENEADIPKFKDFVAGAAAPKAVEAKESAAAPVIEQPKQAASPSSSSASVGDSSRVFASPVAKLIAGEKGIPLDKLTGSGPEGYIIKKDVLGAKLEAPKAASAPKPAPLATPAPTGAAPSYKDIPLSNVRKVIASRLSESKSTIPHYYLTVTVNADKLLKLRELLNSESNGQYKLSINDFVVKATAMALRDVPQVNASWGGDFIRQYNTADIAVAVATPTGLITPIVTGVEGKGLSKISNQIKELAGRAKENKLAPNEYQGGSFTISNLGMFGVEFFTAIINPPHAGILAIGATEDKVVLEGEKPVVTKTFKCTASFDHRVVDGAVGAQFLAKFREYLQNPLLMLL